MRHTVKIRKGGREGRAGREGGGRGKGGREGGREGERKGGREYFDWLTE